jgi:hypothetical protein
MEFNLFHKKTKEDEKNVESSVVLTSLSNVMIHSMPKRFLYKKTGSSKKGHGLGLVILVVGAFALMAIFAVLYIYLSDTSSNSSVLMPENNTKTEEPNNSIALEVSDTINTEKIENEKNSIEEQIRSDRNNSIEPENFPKEDEIMPSEENLNPVRPIISTTTEVIATSTEEINDITALNWQIGPDNDNDGLSDIEEVLIGLNNNKTDTDNDGYDDYSEMLNMYNPAGEGRIGANPKISRYYNPSYFYSFYYPTVWQYENVDGESSILFKLENNQFVQVIVAENPGGQSLNQWYLNEFEQSSIKSDRQIFKAGWNGIRSNNDLTVYLQKNGQSNIFVFSFNLGVVKIWSYKGLFDFMIKSFEVD